MIADNYDGSRPEPPYDTDTDVVDDLQRQLDAANAELQRLRSSPAPVVGGVPELTEDDLRPLIMFVYGDRISLSSTAPKINDWFASHLPALKPGEVVVSAEELRLLRTLRGCVNGWMYRERPATVVLNALVDIEYFESRERERAQATTPEGGAR